MAMLNNQRVYKARIFWPKTFLTWHILWHSTTDILSGIYSNTLSGIYSDILSGILSGILFSHSIFYSQKSQDDQQNCKRLDPQSEHSAEGWFSWILSSQYVQIIAASNISWLIIILAFLYSSMPTFFGTVTTFRTKEQVDFRTQNTKTTTKIPSPSSRLTISVESPCDSHGLPQNFLPFTRPFCRRLSAVSMIPTPRLEDLEIQFLKSYSGNLWNIL